MRWSALALCCGGVASEITSIYKFDYPDKGFCGQESNVTKSWLNPHWLFPMIFGGFKEGHCSDVGYTKFTRTAHVIMHGHNLTFDEFAATQTPVVDLVLADPARGAKKVRAKLCMPSGSGPWPLLIYGHGAGCAPEDYEYLCQVAVVASVYQATPLSPVFPSDFKTEDDAVDAAFLASRLPDAAAHDTGSPLFGKLDGNVLIGGHSMGGGASILAVGEHRAPVGGLALFAPGMYTKPSATPYLANVSVPVLIVSGSMDCGQNALDKQAQPAFDALASEAKVLVVVKGANHCQWIQPTEKGLGVCSTFEKSECHGIERAAQHEIGERLVSAFASATKPSGDWAAFEEFLTRGEAAGTWSFFSSRTSPPTKRLHNECPCGKAVENLLV